MQLCQTVAVGTAEYVATLVERRLRQLVDLVPAHTRRIHCPQRGATKRNYNEENPGYTSGYVSTSFSLSLTHPFKKMLF